MFSLARHNEIKRMFAYSCIEHMVLSSFAFGLGGPIGIFAEGQRIGITTRVVNGEGVGNMWSDGLAGDHAV